MDQPITSPSTASHHQPPACTGRPGTARLSHHARVRCREMGLGTSRQDGKLRKQVFRQQVYVCSVPTLQEDNCPGVAREHVFGEFEDEVKGISGRRDRD